MFRFLMVTTLATAGFAMAGDDGGGAAASPAVVADTDAGSSSSDAVADNDGGDGNAVPTRSFWSRFQFHGTLSQGFIYGSGNNFMSMDTNSGSARWSEGAVNVSMAITDNFHFGAQVHSYIMGEMGKANVQLDWAYADYRLKDWLGFRGGKIKAPIGLYNEIQDTDTLYNWALLPASIYDLEYRSFFIPVIGGELYGKFNLPMGAGTLSYQVFGGQRSIAPNDGDPLLVWQADGISMLHLSGYTYGGSVAWKTPIRGLRAILSADKTRQQDPAAPWPFNPYGVPQLTLFIDSMELRELYSLEFQKNKLYLAAEYLHEPHWVATDGTTDGTSPRTGWYVLGSYHVTDKLTLGAYFSKAVGTSFSDTAYWPYYNPSDPAYYSNDTVLNGRYDFNRFLYLKLEGHYLDGDLVGFLPGDNPNGLQKITRLGIVRLGFTW